MRVDANVSVRPVGTTELGTKVEVKNMNSLRSLGRAIDYEIERQVDGARAGERIVQETRHWDEADGRTQLDARRRKARPTTATSPSPTSCPSRPTDEMRARVRESMPELPAARRARLVEEWGIAESDAPRARRPRRGWPTTPRRRWRRSTAARPRTSSTGASATCSRHLNETGLSPAVLPLAPDGLAELVDLVADGTLSRNQAKDVLAECLARAEAAEAGRRRARARAGQRRRRARRRRRRHRRRQPADVDDYRNGDDKVRKKKHGFFMGEAMKATKGQGNPQVLTRLIQERLERH